ncbi:MAG: FeoA family protein, partial [Paludibacter sp.]
MTTNTTYLSDIKTGDEAIITKVLGHGSFRKRITEMGFVKGEKVIVIKNAPLQDPVEYEIMGYKVSLRRSEAELVEVVSVEEAASL